MSNYYSYDDTDADAQDDPQALIAAAVEAAKEANAKLESLLAQHAPAPKSVLSDEDAAAYQRANKIAAQGGPGYVGANDGEARAAAASAAAGGQDASYGAVIEALQAQGFDLRGNVVYKP